MIQHFQQFRNLGKYLCLLSLAAFTAMGADSPALPWVGKSVTAKTENGETVYECEPRNNIFSSQVFRISPDQTYTLSGEFRVLPERDADVKLYFGFEEQDAQGKVISTKEVNIVGGSDTRLAAPVSAGATTITIVNASAWQKANKDCYVAFETKSDFSDLPHRGELISVAKVEQNTITLRQPVAKDYPADTPVRLHRDRAPYNNSGAEGKVLTEEWQTFSGTVHGQQRYGTSDKKWRPGTVQVRIFLAGSVPPHKKARIQFRNVRLEQPGDRIVVNGKPDSMLATYPRPAWMTVEGTWVGSGTGNPLNTFHAYEPQNFSVDAELSIAKLEGTAAGITVGNVVWGLDGGGDRRFFVEGRDFKTQFLDRADTLIHPDQPFQLHIDGANGKMTFSVNGQRVGECKYVLSHPLYFGLRPHRNTMKIKSFTVHGTRHNGSGRAIPVADRFVDVRQPGKLVLVSFQAPAGRYDAKLMLPDHPEVAAETVLDVDDSGVTQIPADVLQSVYAKAGAKFNLRTALLVVRPPKYPEYRTRVILADCSAAMDFPKGEIRTERGKSRVFLNGEPRPMMQALWSYNGRASGEKAFAAEPVARFAKAKINGNMLILAPYRYLGESSFDLAGLEAEVEEALTKILAENPDTWIDIQFFLFTSEEWNNLHRDELIKLDNGVERLGHAFKQMLMPSYASPSWRKDMAEVIRQTVQAMRKSPYADRIASFRVLYANCGEWNHWGYHEKAFVDMSAPMQKAFGEWLQAKYGSVEALRKAWNRSDVTFTSSNLVPTREQRLTGGNIYRTGAPENVVPCSDYYRFFSEYTVDTILHFTKVIKEASGKRLLAGSYYGYYFGHYYANPYHFQDSGSYALGKLLASPDIDFCGGPNPYYNRINTFWLNGIAGGFALHHKLYVREGDMRTEYAGAPHPHYGVPERPAETPEILKRDFAASRERGIAFYFYDFIADWYRSPELMALIGKLNRLDVALDKFAPARNPAEVALIFSEESVPHLTNAHGDRNLRDFSGDELNRLGAPVDCFTESDLANVDFTPYKVVVFPNSFFVSPETMAAIQKYVCKDNRTVVFLSSPGMLDGHGAFTADGGQPLTGMKLCALPEAVAGTPWSMASGTTVAQAPYQRQTRFANSADGTVLAKFESGEAAVMEKKQNGFRSVVALHPFPDAVFWRELLTRCGCHLWTAGTEQLDNCYFADGLLAYMTRQAGDKTLTLPEKAEIVADALTGEVLAENANLVKFNVPDNLLHTRLIYFGPRAAWEKIQSEMKSVKK